MFKKISSLLLFITIIPGSYSFAATNQDLTPVINSIDMAWMMLGAFLVFFMHAGFAMVETGFTRSKNALNILMKNMMTISIAAVLYFLIGFGLMFGETLFGLIGTSGFVLQGQNDQIGFFVFQAMFAATCATIISGSVAERMKLSSYLLLTLFMTGIIYPIVGHWIWGDGWLTRLGFVDFAGSTVVHLTGAVGGLITVLVLGPRIGKYSKGKVNVIPGHSIPIGALGVFILWFGWFGFNGGSTLAADTSLVPSVIATTLLSASTGVVASGLYSYIKFKRIDATLTLNGALAGLVGITAGAADVSPIGAIITGLIAGIILIEVVQLLDRVLKIDDPVGAITVHGICGIWGTIAVGLFSVEQGLLYTGNAELLGIQAIGVASVILWTALSTGLAIFIVTRFGTIRVPKDEEIAGLDFSEHGSSAYEATNSIYNENPEAQSEFGVGLLHRLDGIDHRKTKPTS